MGFINIFIGSEENVRVKEGKLVVREGREGFPVEDIGCVMVDNLRTNVSVYALNELAKAGAAVIFCDEKHTPYTCLLPHSVYYRRLAVLELAAERRVLHAAIFRIRPPVQRLGRGGKAYAAAFGERAVYGFRPRFGSHRKTVRHH